MYCTYDGMNVCNYLWSDFSEAPSSVLGLLWCVADDGVHPHCRWTNEQVFICRTCYNLLLFFSFWACLFLSCNHSSTPCHQPADLTCFHNCFLPSASLDFSLILVYDYVLLCNSITFHQFLFTYSSFRTFSSLRYINPWLLLCLLKLDLLCTWILSYINLTAFPSLIFDSLRAFAGALNQWLVLETLTYA